jgi:mRNA interferase RelE/StbE
VLRVEISHDAERSLRRLPQKHARQLIAAIRALREHPEPPASAPLQGAPFRRLRVGEYRVIYRVEGDVLKVAAVGKRNDAEIYRRFRRK